MSASQIAKQRMKAMIARPEGQLWTINQRPQIKRGNTDYAQIGTIEGKSTIILDIFY